MIFKIVRVLFFINELGFGINPESKYRHHLLVIRRITVDPFLMSYFYFFTATINCLI